MIRAPNRREGRRTVPSVSDAHGVLRREAPEVGPATPFGKANLATCENELIHIPGSVQPYGALLVVSDPDAVVLQASANTADLLGTPAEEMLNRSLLEWCEDGALAELLEPGGGRTLSDRPIHARVRIAGRSFLASVHTTPSQGIAVELEPFPESRVDRLPHVRDMLEHVSGAVSLKDLCMGFTERFRTMSGYDRVMVYRFDGDGHGEVFAEAKRADLEAFLGNHYPSSDIPARARRLYVRNRVRILRDVDDVSQPMVPRESPVDGADLDMSMCALRSLSPIHLQYLRNMGVSGTLVSSIMVQGKLWGLVACHHYSPRLPSPDLRGLTELLSEMMGVRLSALASLARIRAELQVNRLEQRMAAAVVQDGDWRRPLFEDPTHLLDPVDATGALLLCDGEVQSAGTVPSHADVRALVRRLSTMDVAQDLVVSSSLATECDGMEGLLPEVAGMMAARLSGAGGDWLIWFRPEQVHTVTWGGDPSEAVIEADDLKSLTPRRSFAAWHQSVVGTSAHWSEADLAFGRMVGRSVADVVLQFRAVRVLIAQDQVRRLDAMVTGAEQPALVLDQSGRISVANMGFRRIFGEGPWDSTPVESLAPRFSEPDAFLALCRGLLDHRRSNRIEITTLGEAGNPLQLFIRADVISAPPSDLLGFVLIFSDLTQRQAAHDAQEHFQRVADATRASEALSGAEDEIIEGLVNNAAFAALELAQGIDVESASEAIQALEVSIERSRRLLDELVRNAEPPDPVA